MCDNVSEDSAWCIVCIRKISSQVKRFHCNYTFVSNPFRWSEAIVSTIHTLTNPPNCITSPYRSRSQTKHQWIAIDSRGKKHKHDTRRCASRRQLSMSEQSAIYATLGGSLRGPSDAPSYWSARASWNSWSRRHSVAGAAKPRDHEVPLDLSTNRKERGLQVQQVRGIVLCCATRAFQTKIVS